MKEIKYNRENIEIFSNIGKFSCERARVCPITPG